MQIGRLEEVCLELLRDAENPLVPVGALYQHCIRDRDIGESLTETALLQFLRDHIDVVVVDGVDMDAPVTAEEFGLAGIDMGPRALLKSRMPTREELKKMFRMQLAQMRETLLDALARAKERGEKDRMAEIEIAIENTDAIDERFQAL